MITPDTVATYIRAGLDCVELRVEGDGRHFGALIVSAAFAGKNRVQRQQLVNKVLKEHFDSGILHALSMQTYTPEEWQAAHG